MAVVAKEISILITPAEVVSTQLEGRYVQAEDDEEGRDNLRHQSQALQSAAGREEIIGGRNVFNSACKAFF